jgi:thioester reductase-like protein
MKYLLTGASGFLGRHILEALPRENVTTLGRGKTNDLVVNLSTSVPDLQ